MTVGFLGMTGIKTFCHPEMSRRRLRDLLQQKIPRRASRSVGMTGIVEAANARCYTHLNIHNMITIVFSVATGLVEPQKLGGEAG
jgi:hypothetical protein